jgi:hypothetical protein
MTKRKLPPIPLTKHLADRILKLSGEVQTLSMMFWQKCDDSSVSKSELSELLLRLQQAQRELNSALEICEGLEKISKFKQNMN